MAGSAKHFSETDFETSIEKGVALIDFYADWCGPCKMIAPLIEELSNKYQGRATIGKLDVDKAQNISLKYNVTSIPTVILFVDGKEAKRVVGVRGKDTFEAMIDAALSG